MMAVQGKPLLGRQLKYIIKKSGLSSMVISHA